MQYDKLTFGARFLTIAPALSCEIEKIKMPQCDKVECHVDHAIKIYIKWKHVILNLLIRSKKHSRRCLHFTDPFLWTELI